MPWEEGKQSPWRPMTRGVSNYDKFGAVSEFNDPNANVLIFWDTWLDAATWEKAIERLREESLEKKLKTYE